MFHRAAFRGSVGAAGLGEKDFEAPRGIGRVEMQGKAPQALHLANVDTLGPIGVVGEKLKVPHGQDLFFLVAAANRTGSGQR